MRSADPHGHDEAHERFIIPYLEQVANDMEQDVEDDFEDMKVDGEYPVFTVDELRRCLVIQPDPITP